MACWELANDMSQKEQRCTTLANYFACVAGGLAAGRGGRWGGRETRSAASCISSARISIDVGRSGACLLLDDGLALRTRLIGGIRLATIDRRPHRENT